MDAPEQHGRDEVCRVLIVDDDVDAAELLAEMVGEKGHAVTIAHTAEDALRATSEFRPHFAVVDIGLPDDDGAAVAARIRLLSPRTRMVAWSGYTDEGTRERSLACGFEVFFSKPVAVASLLSLIGPCRSEETV